jgi:threonine aldolase
MRQAGIIAAAGLVALEGGVERLADDHSTARWIAGEVHQIPGIRAVQDTVETNIIVLDVSELGGAAVVQEHLREAGVLVSTRPPAQLRLVTHLQITPAVAAEAVERIGAVAATLRAAA